MDARTHAWNSFYVSLDSSRVAVIIIRHQHRLDRRGRNRLRPAVLEPTAAVDEPLAVAEPQTLRYRVLHTGACITKRSGKQILRIAETCSWAEELAIKFNRVLAIP